MSVFLGHHRNIDRVKDGTNNETLRQLFRTRSLASHTQVLSEPCNKGDERLLQSRKQPETREGRLWKRSPVTKAYRSCNHFEMNGSEGGAGFYFRAGREVKAIREDFPPGKEERKKALSSISTSFSRGVGNPDRLRESLALFSPSFRQ
ncbi:hypothetical protein V6N12_075907 [Hibiscus sabdariffa]